MGRTRGTGFAALALCASGAAFDVAGRGSGARGQLAFAGLAGPPRGARPRARSQARGGRSSRARAGAGARATPGGCLAGAGAAALLGLRRDLRCRVPRFAVRGKKGDKRLSQMDLLRNSFLLTLAELPGPWEVWREERRAAMIRGLDLYEAAQAEAEAPLNSVTEERRRASAGDLMEQPARFKQVRHQVRPPVSLQGLPVTERRRVVIIGAGPSGYTAAMYTARARLRPLLFCGPLPGGQLMLTSDIENFPGYPEAVSGPEMMADLRRQAERFEAEIVEKLVEHVDLSRRPFRCQLRGEEGVVEADSIIIATGATARWLGAPEEEHLMGNGISTCAVCDGALYMDEDVAVVGGGDTALEDALFLARFARSVTLIHRREEFSASALMLERAGKEPKITLRTFRQVQRWLHEDKVLTGAVLEDPRDSSITETVKFAGAFLAIGHDSQSGLFKDQLAMDEDGYILHTRPASSTMTSVPGVFSSGDVSDRRYRQAITAAGHGCQAALDCERWLDKILDVGY